VELAAIAKFTTFMTISTQGRAKLVKMPLAVRGSERRAVAGEAGLSGNLLAQRYSAEQQYGRD
jgi:hypothetical protein